MRNKFLARAGLILLFAALLMFFTGATASAQSTATLQGTVIDPQGGAVPDAKVTVRNVATGVERNTQTDSAGYFQLPSLPVGAYRIEIRHEGFQTLVVKQIDLDVATIVSQNFELKVGELSQTTEVTGEAAVVETATMSVGQVINSKTVQEIPLNGRHFVDLGLLIPGSVTPPQSGFLTAPLRGQGSFAFNTAGNREDSVNFMINGINLNDMVQNQITFQPSINTVQEFKVDNSTYSAEYGRNSGAIVNIATRSGSNQFHGEAFEFLRNEALDARNFFNPRLGASGQFIPKGPFKRNQFGTALGGPIWKDHTFFFFSYEGLRQRQGITINNGVLSDAQRATAQTTGNPTVVKLLDLIPKSNATNAQGNAIFVGSATAPVNIDQWTGDVSHRIGKDDHLHGYYVFQRDLRQEPILQGNSIPGFGDTRQSHRQIFTLNETHIFGSTLVNEARLGFNRIHITFTPNAQLNPTDFNINDGITLPIGLPQINITAIGLNFGGPAGFPQGRGDTTGVFSDTLSWLLGKHSFKFGGEGRRFYNNNFNLDIGRFNFADVNSFINGYAIQYDQPVTNTVTPLTTNPPFATPINLTGSISFSPPVSTTNPTTVSPASIDPNFNNAYAQSWNLNVEREITPSLAVMIGYFGSKGTHLRIARNTNQCNLTGNGCLSSASNRPFTKVSPSSAIDPGVALRNIIQVSSEANSSYNALWITANKRLSHGLQFNASYTFSKSIDNNSLNSQGTTVQDSFNIRNDRGLSDFDARHRFVINTLYELPFRGNRWIEGWQLSTITQAQSGNPLYVATSVSNFTGTTLNGIATLRPDLVGSVQYLNDPALWFNNSVCDPRVTNPCPAGTVCP